MSFNIFFFCLKAESAAMVKSTNAKEEKKVSSENFDIEKQDCVQKFDNWSETDQVDFVEYLLARMCHYQHGQINTFLKPMLQRDFISALPGKKIFLILFATYIVLIMPCHDEES